MLTATPSPIPEFLSEDPRNLQILYHRHSPIQMSKHPQIAVPQTSQVSQQAFKAQKIVTTRRTPTWQYFN